MKIDALKFQAKGWSPQEIEHAKQVLQQAENKKHPRVILFEKIAFTLLFIFIIALAVTGTALIEPFLLVMSPTGAIIVILVLGLIFGSISSILIHQMDELTIHHHLAISFIIPVVAIITSILITKQAQIINTLAIHQPIALGVAFSIGSLIPFAALLWIERNEDGIN